MNNMEENKDAMDTPESAKVNGAPAEETAEATADPAMDLGTAKESEKKDKKADAKKWKAEAEALTKALDAEKKRAEEAADKYLRVVAEYDNFRKRSQKEKDAIYGDAVSDTLKGIIPIIDNLQYAQKYQNGDREKFAEGVELILGQLPEILSKMNIQMFGTVGEAFNPEIHNAVFHEENDEFGENVISEVLQCGYMHGERVIRYAMVKVAN